MALCHVMCCAVLPCQASWDDVSDRLTELGFEKGWGKDVALIREQFRQLLDILQVTVGSRACVEVVGTCPM